MNNIKNKKSSSLWTHKLFKKSGTSHQTLHSKTYFAHRYRDDQIKSGQFPLSALFSGMSHHLRKPYINNDNVKTDLGWEKLLLAEAGKTVEINPHLGLASNTAVNDIAPALHSQMTVINCYHETLDTKTFRLGNSSGQIFEYSPGQYITITVVIAGQEYKRSYSIASSPLTLGTIEITVKRAPNGGVVSNWLIDNLKVGDTVSIKGPYGRFSCCQPPIPEKILFMAAGSGIVPIMSMLRWLIHSGSRADIMLILSFRTLYDIIYGDELKLIAARHTNVKLIITLTQEPLVYGQWQGLTGRISQKIIANCVADLPKRAVYLCGPDAFMADCKDNLENLGLPAGQLFSESFNVTSNTLLLVTNKPYQRQGANYQIKFAKSGKTITSDSGLTLLEIAENSGVRLGHECRAGNCGECMVKCLEGSAEMTEQAEIDEIDRKKGWIYACCAYPTSNIVLDA